MSALTLVATARDAVFAARVAMIAMKVAINVANEDPATAEHAARLLFAGKVLRGDMNNKLLASAIIASNGSIAANIDSNPDARGSTVPDGDIEFAMAGVVTAMGRAET